MAKQWLRAAGWWAADYAYALDRQSRSFVAKAEPLSMRAGHKAPVVVIPGVYESWKFLLPLVTQVHDRGHPIYVVESLQFNVKPVLECAALVSAYLEESDLSGVIILAHSKGGLIGKQVMVEPAAAGRIRAMLAVATPFSGSDYARFMVSRSLRIFSPDDPTIVGLSSQDSANARIVSVYAAFDPHIPTGSELEGAKNVQLDTGGHFRILRDPRILAELDDLAGLV